jgi:hypothetical protein
LHTEKVRFSVLLVGVVLALALAGCSMGPEESFIQGTWDIAQPDDYNEFYRWTFHNGRFTREQEIFRGNPLYTTGSYRVEVVDGDLMTLELYDFAGDRISYENNPMTLQIRLDPSGDRVEISNTPFVRVGP